jgi:hypothetical protein
MRLRWNGWSLSIRPRSCFVCTVWYTGGLPQVRLLNTQDIPRGRVQQKPIVVCTTVCCWYPDCMADPLWRTIISQLSFSDLGTLVYSDELAPRRCYNLWPEAARRQEGAGLPWVNTLILQYISHRMLDVSLWAHDRMLDYRFACVETFLIGMQLKCARCISLAILNPWSP